MRKLFALLAIGAMAAPVWAIPNPHVAGDFQGWDAAANPMNGPIGGVYDLTFTGMAAGSRHEYKITDGTFSNTVPSGPNSWFFADAAGEITLTYDTNVYNDGWKPDTDRLGVSTDPMTWTATGDWQGWDNANAATAMTPMGGGIYMYEAAGLAPGNHAWKAVVTGSWDSISIDGRSVATANWDFVTDETNDTARMWINAYEGTAKLEIIPEPATLALLALGGLALVRRR